MHFVAVKMQFSTWTKTVFITKLKNSFLSTALRLETSMQLYPVHLQFAVLFYLLRIVVCRNSYFQKQFRISYLKSSSSFCKLVKTAKILLSDVTGYDVTVFEFELEGK